MEYLVVARVISLFRFLFVLAIIPGAMMDLEIVWKISDITNSFLSRVVISETKSFLQVVKEERVPILQAAERF